jgi:hypothetical protein
VSVTPAGDDLQLRTPIDLFNAPPSPGGIAGDWFAVTADGRRFLFKVSGTDQNASAPLTVVLNWPALLK